MFTMLEYLKDRLAECRAARAEVNKTRDDFFKMIVTPVRDQDCNALTFFDKYKDAIRHYNRIKMWWMPRVRIGD